MCDLSLLHRILNWKVFMLMYWCILCWYY